MVSTNGSNQLLMLCVLTTCFHSTYKTTKATRFHLYYVGSTLCRRTFI